MAFLWELLVFTGFPLISVVIMFFIKKKLLWISPFISTALCVGYSVVIMDPSILSKDGHRAIFLGITVPMQFAICSAFTVCAYIVCYLLKKRKIDDQN